jgi:hypothetical protein
MTQQYAVPLYNFEPARAQVPTHLGSLLLRTVGEEVEKALTSEILKSVPEWRRLSSLHNIDSRVTADVLWIFRDQGTDVKSKKPWARKPREQFLALADADGPEWVYPGDAAGGIYRRAVDAVLKRMPSIIERVIR